MRIRASHGRSVLPKYAQLQRTFSLANDAENSARNSQDFDYARYWQPNSFLSSVSWEQLLEQSFCVVLGEAGIGKTTEFRSQADRLQGEGKVAFFVPLNIASDKDSLSDRFAESERSLSMRQADLDVGYFFLDAVDEARLTNHADLEKALRNVVRQISSRAGAFTRARFIMSSRISDWYTPDVPSIVERVISGVFRRDKKTALTAQVYYLDPLSPEDARALAKCWGVARVEDFWGAVEAQGYEPMATVPLDLERMVHYWNKNGYLGGLTEMLDESIKTRLSEHNPSHQKRQGNQPPDNIRCGAELLAAACSLSGRPFVAVPDYEGPIPDNTVAANAALKNWTAEAINVLLSTAVFDEASYGRVRFHHRTTRDYLAAKWMSRRTQAGWPIKDALSLFIVDPFDEGPVVVPARQPVLAWLASMEPKVRERVIALCPDTVFSGGDPEAWSAEDMEQVLRRFAQLPFHVLAARATPLDVGTLTRIGRRAGEKVLTSLLEQCAADADSNMGVYLATHFLLIVRYAMLRGCAEAVFELYATNDGGPLLKSHALAALAAIGTDMQRQDVRKHLLEGRITTNALRVQACRVVFPRQLSAQELVEVVAGAEPEPQADGPLSRYVRQDVLPQSSARDALALLDGVLSKLEEMPAEAANGLIRSLLLEVFIAALLKQEEDGEPLAVFCRAMPHINIGLRASPRWLQTVRTGLQDKIDEFLAKHPQLRRALVLAFAESHPGDVRSPGLNAGSGVVKLLAEDDLSWACQLACDGTLPRRQRRAAFVLLIAVTRARPSHERHALIKKAIASCDSPERRTAWGNELTSMRFMAKHKRREARRQREQMSERERQRAAIRKCLENNKVGIRCGDNLNELVFVLHQYVEPFHSAGLGDISGSAFRQDYGPDLWAAVSEGFRQFWRKTDAPLRSDVLLTQVPDVALVGLVGIALAVEDGYDVGSERNLATRLVRYALWNLAGAPAWFEKLASAYPEAVADAIWVDIEKDLKVPMAGNPHTSGLNLAMQGPAVLRTEIAKRLSGWLRQTVPNASTIPDARHRQVLEIIRDAGADDGGYLESLAGKLLDAHAGNGNWQGVGYWLGFLLTIAPARAWKKVEARWNSGAERSEMDAVHLACGLTGASGTVVGAFPALNFLPATAEMVPVIESMHAFFCEHILRENDIHHRSGEVYSPGERDVAQSVRVNLTAHLARIPGRVARESLRRLADTVKGSPQEAGFLAYLHDHASIEAAGLTFLEPRDVPGLGDIYCRTLRSEAELFEVVLDRLETIRASVEGGPFSDRVLLKGVREEKNLQMWLAARLEETCGRHGFRVTREDEVDEGKKPDIHIHHAKGTVCLEIKPLDSKRYSPKKLKEALEGQFVGQYMGRRNSHHGIFVLFLLTKNRRWRGLPGKGKKDFSALLVFLQKYANALKANKPGVGGLKVFGIDCTGHRAP